MKNGDKFDDIPFDELRRANPQQPNFNMPEWKSSYTWYAVVILVILVILVFKPWYTVQPGEVGVVMRLGKFNRTVTPGFHFRLPRPIEMVETPNVEQIRRVEVGFETVDPGPPARYRTIEKESRMLTGDENVVIAEMIVQYRVTDPKHYLFNVADVHDTVKDISESALRQVIGDYAIDAALTWGRAEIEGKITSTIQEVSNRYKMGVNINNVRLQSTHPPEQVEPAFLAVVSSREDQSRFVNEADSYRNSQIPKAEGEVKTVLQEAEAYRVERVARAKGEVERFSALLGEYRRAPEIMQTRMYMEMMEKVMAGKPKLISGSSQNVMKLLNISPAEIGLVTRTLEGGVR